MPSIQLVGDEDKNTGRSQGEGNGMRKYLKTDN